MKEMCIFNLCFLPDNFQSLSMERIHRNNLPYKYDAWCKSGFMKGEKYTFVWSISDFSPRTESNGVHLTSEEFTIKGPDDKISK